MVTDKSPMGERLVAPAIIPAILDMAIRNRVHADPIFSQAQVDPALVHQTGTFISVDQMLRLLDAACEVVSMPAFGLALGRSIQYHSLDLVGQLIATSRDMRQAWNELLRFKDLLLPYALFELTVTDTVARFDFSVDRILITRNLPVHHEIIASTVLSIAGSIVAVPIPLRKVQFMHAAPEYVEEYEKVFQVPVEFGCQCNSVLFDPAFMDTPLLTSYPEYNSTVRQQALEKLRSIESHETLSNKVSYYISASLGVRSTQLEEVAEHFNITPRTLQRKLKHEGVSFVEIRDGCRHARALCDLADANIDIDTLAELLGFSDASNFYHAFRRWQGVSPGVYRKQVLAQRGAND